MTHLDIYSDLACPWCFIGKRHLDEALASLPEAQRPTVRWRAYQLRPDYPVGQSEPARPILEAKFGGGARFEQVFARVQQLGAEAGIQFDMNIQKAFNTRLAHRAVAMAHEVSGDRGHAAAEALFSALFEQGQDLSRVDVVAAVLAKVLGVDVASLTERLQAGEATSQVDHDLAQGQALGVTGVPFFVLDGKYAMSGAQPAEAMVEFITHAGSGT